MSTEKLIHSGIIHRAYLIYSIVECVEINISLSIEFQSRGDENVLGDFLDDCGYGWNFPCTKTRICERRRDERATINLALTILTHLPARSRRSDSRSAGAAGSDADCRGGSADAAVDREMEWLWRRDVWRRNLQVDLCRPPSPPWMTSPSRTTAAVTYWRPPVQLRTEEIEGWKGATEEKFIFCTMNWIYSSLLKVELYF